MAKCFLVLFGESVYKTTTWESAASHVMPSPPPGFLKRSAFIPLIEHTNTHTHTLLSAGFVLQSHAIYTMGPAGLCSSSMSLLQAAKEKERERERDEEEGELGSLPSGFCCTGCSLHGNIALSCNQIKE